MKQKSAAPRVRRGGRTFINPKNQRLMSYDKRVEFSLIFICKSTTFFKSE